VNDSSQLTGSAGKLESSLSPELDQQLKATYTLKIKLGNGTFGPVYLAQHVTTERECVIKFLTDNSRLDSEALKRLDQAMKAVSKMEHANVVRVFECDVPLTGVAYIVTEYVDGKDLGDIIEHNGPVSVDEAIDVFINVAAGLGYAHRQGILHRNIKPANILLSQHGGDSGVKIADFGLSQLFMRKELAERVTAEATDEILSEPYYMSPEQCNGDPLDARSDIYSLGCVMYEAVTGQPPFGKRNAVKAILAHVKEKPQRISGTAGNLEAFESVVLKCLEKDPARRYKTASDLCADLERLRQGQAPKAKAPLRASPAVTVLALAAVCLIGVALLMKSAPVLHQDSPQHNKPSSQDEDLSKFIVRADLGRNEMLNNKETRNLSIEAIEEPSSSDFKSIKNMHKLLRLNVQYAHISDSDLLNLEKLPLEFIRIGQTPITDDGMEILSRIPTLRFLDVPGSRVGGPGLAAIAKLPALQILELESDKISDSDLKALRKCKALRILALDGCPISDASAKVLSEMNLVALFVHRCNLSDRFLAQIARSRTIKYLDISGNLKITESGLAQLQSMHLNGLWLDNTGASEKGNLKFLAKMHDLKFLRVGRVAQVELDEIKKELSNAKVFGTEPSERPEFIARSSEFPDLVFR
jgi:serine/threonine protein kinase